MDFIIFKFSESISSGACQLVCETMNTKKARAYFLFIFLKTSCFCKSCSVLKISLTTNDKKFFLVKPFGKKKSDRMQDVLLKTIDKYLSEIKLILRFGPSAHFFEFQYHLNIEHGNIPFLYMYTKQ